MKRALFFGFALAACLFSAQAQYFTNGNLAVVRVGGAGQLVSSNGIAVHIDQFTTAGSLVNTVDLPSAGSNAFVLDNSTTEGYMTLSGNNEYLVLAGYNTTVGSGFGTPFGLNGTASSAVSRSIATVDGYGNYALQITNNLAFTTWPISSAVFDGTNNFWMEGENSTNQYEGILYVGSPSAPTTVVVADTGNEEAVMNLYNGSLFIDSSFSPNGIYQVLNTNLPVAPLPESANSVNPIIPLPSASRNKDFVFDPGMTTCYYADSSIGIVKFTNNAGTWVSNYTIPATNAGGFTTKGALGITADWTQSPVVVYATTSESSGNRLIELVDSGAGAVATLLAQAFTNHLDTTNVFRGVRFAPNTFAPMITSQPASVAQSANGSATFTVTALGTPTLSYQWFTNGKAMSGATTASLTINNVTTFENGTVLNVVVTNAYGKATSSNAVLTVNASYFMGGNLAVVRVGGAGQLVSSNGIAVHIDQFTTAGSLINTVDLPTGGSNAFVLDNSTTEGYVTLSANHKYLVLGGYNTPVGSGFGTPFGLNGTASSAVSRSIATVDGYGNYALQITNNLAFTTWPISSAVFDGTNNFWMEGESSTNQYEGILYVGSPAAPTTVVVADTGNEEAVMNLYNGSLFIDSSFSPNGIYQVLNTNLPVAPLPESANSVNPVIPLPSASRNKDFVFDPGMTTCYYADSSIGIVKFTNNAGAWVSNYTIPATNAGGFTTKGALGITADWTQSPVVVYATTSESSGNRLIELVDSGASAVATLLAQALTNHLDTTNVFRGVRFVPGEAPMITNEPAPVVQAAGGNATFTVGATGTPALSYQWYTNGVAVSGAVASSFTLTALTTNQNGTMVSAVVSNGYGAADSSSALLTVQVPNSPFDVTINPPTSVTVNAGGTASFSVSAIGASLTYFWQLNGVPLTDGGSVSGSSTATVTISPAFATYNGTYTVLASNSFGTLAANNFGTLKVIDPVIVTQPVGATNLPGASPMLSVTAAGAPTLTYQWLSNGVALAGANASSLTVANGGTIVSALYSVIVSNGLGNSITSAPTTVSFTPVLLSDTFSYPDGNLFGDPGSPWIDINGTNPEVVTNGRVQISESNSTTDAQSRFSQPESGTVIWASFIINLSTLPSNPGGVYFANIEDTNFGFYGRLFTLTSNQAGFTPNISPVAFPGTYRLGIADAQGDSSPSAKTGPNAVVPLDLAPGIDYQVVFYLDLVNAVSGMAVNPASLSDVTATSPGGVSSGPATDSFTPALAMDAFGLRQRTDTTPKGEGEGVMEMDNLVVSFDWNGAGSGYPVVTQGITATNPVIGLQPVGTTNFSGTAYTMEVAASGIGAPGTGLSYAWYQNGKPLSDGFSVLGSATPTLTLNPLVATNSGTYYVIVKGAAGSPVQSSNAIVLVNVAATPPVFTVQPAASTTNSQGGSVTFDSLATGTGPIVYAWYFSNSFGLTQLGGETNADLTLTGLSTNQSGTYFVIATGDNGVFQTQSSNAVLIVTGPKSVTIGYLRSLLNPITYEPSDLTTFFSVTGVITTATNQTTGDTASYYLQDSTGGINLFVTFGADFRPALGDEVTAVGTLSTYVDNYELDVSEGSAGYTNYVVGTNFPLPTPILFPWGNDTAPLSPYLSTNVEGSVVVITNLYFENITNGQVFVAGTDYTISNNTGETYTVFVSDQDTNFVVGKPIPQFATSIAGPLIQDDALIGISFTVYSNLVVPMAIPPLTNVGNLTAAVTGSGGTNNVTLSWTAVPSNYTYSVWFATNLLQPFSNLVSGLKFTNTIGTYTDSGQTSATKFYEISSP